MTSVFRYTAKPTFRDLHGRFVRAERALLEIRRDEMRAEGRRFVEIAQSLAPGGAGHTVAKQIGFQTFVQADAVGFKTQTGPIARYHIFGTGIYGPRGRVIRPTSKKVLHFFISGAEFFRPSVKGIKPNRFMSDAYRQWLPGAEAAMRRIATRYKAELKG